MAVFVLLALPGVAVAATPPGIPSGVSLEAGDQSVTVSWDAADDGGDPVYRYTVTADPGGARVEVPGVSRSAVLTGLTNGVAYRFTVTATNRVGTGPPSAVSDEAVPVGPPGGPAGPVLLREDFAASPGGMVAVAGGTWAVASGRYTLSDPADGGAEVANANLAVHDVVVPGDFTLTATAAATPTASPFNDFSVVFGLRDPADYWFASFSEGNDGDTSGVFRVEGGVRTELTDITVPIAAGTVYPIRIERRGTSVRVFRSDQLAASVVDPALAAGKVGFGSRNDGGTFDDLVVTGPPPPPPPPADPPGVLARIWRWITSLFADAPAAPPA